MASFTKRGDTWQYAVSNYVDGKSRPIRKSGFRTKKEAQVAAAIVEQKLNKGQQVVVKNKSFSQYFEEWIEIFKDGRHKDTKKRYKTSLDHVKAYFKDKPMQQITRSDYQEFINQFGKGHSKETVRKLNVHVSACVKSAMVDGFIGNDFTNGIELHFTVKAKSEDEKFISYKESVKLYDALLERLALTNLSSYIILLALVTGMRYQEIVGLTHVDFDFDNNSIDINKTWDWKDGTGFGDLKADAKPRKIKVDETSMTKMKELIESQSPDRYEGLIFFSPGKSKVVSNNAANKTLRKVLKELGIDDITMHALRHTHASAMLYDGATIQSVSKRLGHASIATTLRYYTHVLEELEVKDEEIAFNLYSKKDNKNEDV